MEFYTESKILIFNTDVDYNFNNKLEEVIKIISEKFNIDSFIIDVV
ncbi:MAG: hypothetical protein PHT94_02060 [Candidatus Nanoarchaeia archaeon]|nr:hypothetical protein [Candidatus Nanoarchaeia archaeon]